jgi:hypothetical protein
MKIPEKLKIGGIYYDVKVAEELENRTGEFDFTKLQIVLEKNKPEVMELTLLHEIFHVINNEVREDIIEFFAQSMYQIMQDNPELFSVSKGGVK